MKLLEIVQESANVDTKDLINMFEDSLDKNNITHDRRLMSDVSTFSKKNNTTNFKLSFDGVITYKEKEYTVTNGVILVSLEHEASNLLVSANNMSVDDEFDVDPVSHVDYDLYEDNFYGDENELEITGYSIVKLGNSDLKRLE